MAGERLIAADRLIKSRWFLRWVGTAVGLGGLAAAAVLFWDANNYAVDDGTRNAEYQFAGVLGLFGLAVLCAGVAAWVSDPPAQPNSGAAPEPGAEADGGGM